MAARDAELVRLLTDAEIEWYMTSCQVLVAMMSRGAFEGSTDIVDGIPAWDLIVRYLDDLVVEQQRRRGR